MHESTIIDLTLQAMMLVLILSMPPIVVATVVGLGVSLLQALTQVQEQTLGFAVKLIVITIALVFTAFWVGSELFNYCLYILDAFPKLVK